MRRAWIWWSFATPRWTEFASRYLDETEMEELHQAAVQGQLEWPKGHVFSQTEMKSHKQKWEDADAAISDIEGYLDDEFGPGRLAGLRERGGDSRVIKEIQIFVKNLRYRTDTGGHTENYPSDLRMIDGFVSRLNSVRQVLKKSSMSNDENWDWYRQLSDLINKLNHLKKVLQMIAAIHFEALPLWRKGAPYHPHPGRTT